MGRPGRSSGGSVFRRHDHPTCPPIGRDGRRPDHRCKGRWTGIIELPTEDGRRRRATFFGTSQKEVVAKLAEAQTLREAGRPVRSSTTKLAVYLEDWIEVTLAASDRRASTKSTYRTLIRTHLATDSLSRAAIGRIKPTDVEALIVRLRAKSLAPSTVRQVFLVLRQVLDTAARDGLIVLNPAAQVRRPGIRTQEAHSLTPAEVRKLLEAAKGSRFEVLMRFLVMTGLRKGEALALHWSDVDLYGCYITVRGTLARGEAGLEIGMPKTERSRRTIPIAQPTVDMLKSLRTTQTAERELLGSDWNAGDLVFTSQTGAPMDPRNVLRAVKATAKKAHLENVGVHTLRHSAASAMLEAGVPLHTVSEILGHASIQVTGDIYGHVSTEGARAAVNRLSEAVGLDPAGGVEAEPNDSANITALTLPTGTR